MEGSKDKRSKRGNPKLAQSVTGFFDPTAQQQLQPPLSSSSPFASVWCDDDNCWNWSADQYDMFPAMNLIMGYLGDTEPFSTMGQCRLVCKSWKNITDRCGMLRAVDDSMETVARETRMLDRCILELTGRRYNTDTCRRIEFLSMTTVKLRNALVETRVRRAPYQPNSVPLLQILARLFKQVSAIREVINGVSHNTRAVTVNFDALELGLRRRMQELITCSDCPSDCIMDRQVKSAWGATFGYYTGTVAWEQFSKRFLSVWKSIDSTPFTLSNTNTATANMPVERSEPDTDRDQDANSNTDRHLRAFLCFPGDEGGDDIVTPYAVHLVCALYGPPGPKMWTDFSSLMRRGFIGVVTMIHAENLLKMALDVLPGDSMVVRYSRQMPELFAITTIRQSTGEVSHYRNVDSHKRTIPIMQYLQKMMRSGWKIAEFYLSEDALTPAIKDLAHRSKYGIKSPYGVVM